MAKEVLEMEVKSNIGEVAKDTEKLAKSTGDAKEESKGLAKGLEDVGKSSSKSVSGVKKLAGAFGGLMKSLGIISLIAAVFTTLKEAVERNQKAMDLMETVVSTVSTTFNQVVTVLSDVVNWVTESTDSVDALGRIFKSIGTIIKNVVMIAFTPFRLSLIEMKTTFAALQLGWEKLFGDDESIKAARQNVIDTAEEFVALKDSLVNSVKEIGSAGKSIAGSVGEAISEVGTIYEKAADGLSKISIKANYEQAQATVAAVKSAKFAAVEFAKLNAEKLKEAELFRQIRDDETKTFAERIQANKDLKKSLEEQQKLQSEQIQKQITAAALAVEQNGNDENKLALMEAQNAQLELEETITGQLSEQKTNQVGLEKELLETQKEIRAEGLTGLERELQDLQDAYDLKLEMARKSGMDTTAITAQYTKEQGDIIKTAAEKEEALAQSVKDQKVAMAQKGLSLITEIAGESTAIGKAAAIAQTTITGIQSVSEAFKSGTANIPMMTATGGAFGYIQAGLAGAFSAVQLAKLGAAGGGGGGGGGAGAGAVAAPPAPQMMSGAFDISGGVAPEAMKAFVVTDEMTNSQNQLANIRRRATI